MKLIKEYIDFKDLEVIKEDVEIHGEKKKKWKIRGPFLEAENKNRNGRIYSSDLLIREVKKYNEEKIKTNRSMGQLDHPECNLSSEFDVLTSDGWKQFLELNVGDPILTLNDDGVIEENKIERIINEPYKGYGYKVCGRGIDSAFTPNHRFVLKNRYGKTEIATLEEIYNNRTKYSKHKIIKTGVWIGSEQSDQMILHGVRDEEYSTHFKRDVREDLKIDMLTFVKFLGIWLSEGCVSKEKYQISISQNKGEVCDKIESMLNKFPISWNRVQSDESKKVNFYISDIRLWKYLKVLGNCYTKYIPKEIKQLDPMYLSELIDWFIMGDGRNQTTNYNTVRKNLFSVSKRLVEDLHECLIKSGGSGNWTVIEPKDDYIFADHIILAENKSDLYQLHISTTQGIYLDPRFLSIERIEHNGNVYCLTVKNSNFYMKENNKAFWTGNSPVINLDRVSHIIESLEMIDNRGIGVAKILETPMGKIAEALLSDGVILGMSTRGVGSLDGEKVQEDFQMIAVDIVAEPSAQCAFVEGIMENAEWIFKNDEWIQVKVKALKEEVDKVYRSKSRFCKKDVSKETLNILNSFIKSM